MVYTDSQKRRDTKKKWKRRMVYNADKSEEMRKFYNRLSYEQWSDEKMRRSTLKIVEESVACYDSLSYFYKWMLRNLSGG
jgi:hypothetical protein